MDISVILNITNYIFVLIFGIVVSLCLADISWKKYSSFYIITLILFALIQAVFYFVLGETVLYKCYPLLIHIPLILLSALHHEDDQVKGIEAGAEVYVTKPFNVKYLEKVVYRLIQRESDLKEYYSSIFSSFTVENGNCIHKEDQEFLDKVLETIEKNITNPDLSVELLSSDLGYSTRQFYRKLKPITEKSPADIIKEYRLTMAERLLLTKNLTIEEIMDRTGFNNRGTFYKLFSSRFGMPPRQYREQQKDSVKKELTD